MKSIWKHAFLQSKKKIVWKIELNFTGSTLKYLPNIGKQIHIYRFVFQNLILNKNIFLTMKVSWFRVHI